jgi:uncharacterized membrane protein (UPF0127 family)
LPEDRGMLFLFPEETHGAFWMKDTPISLDMIFIRSGKIVDIIKNTVPLDETLLTPRVTYTSVLEVPGGYVSRQRINVGDSTTLPRAKN